MPDARPLPLRPRRKDSVPIVEEAGWASRPVWKGAANVTYTGIRSSERTARSEPPYQLSYPGPVQMTNSYQNSDKSDAAIHKFSKKCRRQLKVV